MGRNGKRLDVCFSPAQNLLTSRYFLRLERNKTGSPMRPVRSGAFATSAIGPDLLLPANPQQPYRRSLAASFWNSRNQPSWTTYGTRDLAGARVFCNVRSEFLE